MRDTICTASEISVVLFGLYALVCVISHSIIRWAIAKCTIYAEKGVTCPSSLSDQKHNHVMITLVNLVSKGHFRQESICGTGSMMEDCFFTERASSQGRVI